MATSIGQEGSGFPFLSSSVYKYLCGDSPMQIELSVEDVTDFEAKDVIQKVCSYFLTNIHLDLL